MLKSIIMHVLCKDFFERGNKDATFVGQTDAEERRWNNMVTIQSYTMRQTVLFLNPKQENGTNKDKYWSSGSKLTSSFLAVAEAQYKQTVYYPEEEFVAAQALLSRL